MSGYRCTAKLPREIVAERVWSSRVLSLFSKALSPPYCCVVLLDPHVSLGFYLYLAELQEAENPIL